MLLTILLVLGLYSPAFSLEELTYSFKGGSIVGVGVTFPSGTQIIALKINKIPPGTAWEYSGFQPGDLIVGVYQDDMDKWIQKMTSGKEYDETLEYFLAILRQGKKIGSVIFKVCLPMGDGNYDIYNSTYRLLKFYK